MIATKEQISSLMGLGTSYNTQIDALILPLQNYVCTKCANLFLRPDQFVRGNTISFIKGSPDKIQDSRNSFLDAKFFAGMDLYIKDSRNNDGFKTIGTLTSGELQLTSTNLLNSEEAYEDVFISRVQFPSDIVLPFAKYLYRHLTTKGVLVKSETLPGGYSVQYLTDEEFFSSLFSPYMKVYR